MSNLLIVIIAIALVAIAALATIFYGGNSFNRGKGKAKAVSLINQMEQIKMASNLYMVRNQGIQVTGIDALTPEYLSDSPELEGMDWAVEGDNVVVKLQDFSQQEADEVCLEAWKTKTGETSYTIPACNNVAEEDVCCYNE